MNALVPSYERAVSWPRPPDRFGDLLERAAADIGGDDGARPGGDVARERVGGAQAQHLVPDDHLPHEDDHREREQRADVVTSQPRCGCDSVEPAYAPPGS